MSIIYNDNFKSYSTGTLTTVDTNWTVEQGGQSNASITNGSGATNSTGSSWSVYEWNSGTWNSLTSWGEITVNGSTSSSTNFGAVCCVSSGPVYYLFNVNNGAWQIQRSGATLLTSGTYTPGTNDVIAVSFNGSTNVVTGYVNGVSVGSATDGSPLTVTGPAGIAWYNGGASSYMGSARGGLGAYPPGTVYTLTAAQGAFSLTGETAVRDMAMPAAEGSFGLTGYTTNAKYSLGASQGSFALTGEGVTLNWSGAPVQPGGDAHLGHLGLNFGLGL